MNQRVSLSFLLLVLFCLGGCAREQKEARSTEKEIADFSGEWEIKEGLVSLNQEGDRVSGTLTVNDRDRTVITIQGTVHGNRLNFLWHIPRGGTR